MKIACVKSYPRSYANKWEKWFAWHPVKMPWGETYWLTTVERKETSDGWEYKDDKKYYF